MEENRDFLRPKSATYLASNEIKLPLNCYIIQAFRNRRSSSAENRCGTGAAEQIRTVTPCTAFLIRNEVIDRKARKRFLPF